MRRINRPRLAVWSGLVLSVALAAPLGAQTTTGTIRGQVTNETGQPVASADVVATNAETGAQRRTLTSASGQYVLAGLQPGTYQIAVTMLGYNAPPRSVRVLIGQSLTVDLQLTPQAVELEGIRSSARASLRRVRQRSRPTSRRSRSSPYRSRTATS